LGKRVERSSRFQLILWTTFPDSARDEAERRRMPIQRRKGARGFDEDVMAM
jgi:hypothetical protein